MSSTLITTPPTVVTPTQGAIYKLLTELDIPYERVECAPTVTMDDCRAIDATLGCPTVKSVFLRNRQGTAHYLYVTHGDKPFVTRDFCGALGVPRVSFASAEELAEMLGVEHGATTPLAIVADTDCHIRLVVDEDILTLPHIACPDGTTTCYMRLATTDIFSRYIPSTCHPLTTI